jgi:ubiquinone/menaquinone biosynthesis C-methylase UbiE
MTEERQVVSPTTFELMVGAYERWAEPVSAPLAEIALKRAGLRKGSCVLDVGAGTGALAVQAAALGHDELAIDIAPAMVRRVDDRLRGYVASGARVMDGQHLDLRDNSFDTAFSVFAATLFPDPQRALSEMVRVIRPGGALSIVHWGTPSGADIFVILSRALQGLVWVQVLLLRRELRRCFHLDIFAKCLQDSAALTCPSKPSERQAFCPKLKISWMSWTRFSELCPFTGI